MQENIVQRGLPESGIPGRHRGLFQEIYNVQEPTGAVRRREAQPRPHSVSLHLRQVGQGALCDGKLMLDTEAGELYSVVNEPS